jgi:hypothetical protein
MKSAARMLTMASRVATVSLEFSIERDYINQLAHSQRVVQFDDMDRTPDRSEKEPDAGLSH